MFVFVVVTCWSLVVGCCYVHLLCSYSLLSLLLACVAFVAVIVMILFVSVFAFAFVVVFAYGVCVYMC